MSNTSPDTIPYLNSQPVTSSRRMYEWSFPRKPWKPEKILAARVNALHAHFLEGEADLEQYVDLNLNYLSQFQSAENAADFLASISDSLCDKAFCQRASAFAKTLRTRCQNFVGDAPATENAETEGEQADVVPVGEREPIEKIKQRKMKATIAENWDAYRSNAPGSQDRLLNTILQFARTKLRTVFHFADEIATTTDDIAQEVAFKAWMSLDTIEGDGRSFYRWLNRVCYTERCEAYELTNEDASTRVSLLVESEEEPGTFEDNPLLNPTRRVSVPRELPAFIQGFDRMICEYIREGLNYREIGEVLVMSEKAVSNRVARMRMAVLNTSAGVPQ